VSLTPEPGRLALDAADGQTDAWQVAQAIMRTSTASSATSPRPPMCTRHARGAPARRGVCQDFAHVMLGLCRALKIPARYVSGYLYNGPADQLKGAQASHAWVEVLRARGRLARPRPHQQPAGRRPLREGRLGRDYADVSPLKGTYRGTAQRKLK
jgi:transglutaminase-like putative cysteine protease